MKKRIKEPCLWCNNALIDDELRDDNDYSATCVGDGIKGFRIMLCSGNRKPLRIDVEKWDEKKGWHLICQYAPKFCPNCGREIIEYKHLD